jgi:hypothetical protein
MEEDILALTQELTKIKLILADNKLARTESDEEAVYQQPRNVAEFKEHIQTDIKNLPVFTGEGYPSLNEWLQDVAPLIQNLDRLLAGTYDYQYYLREIRRKIQGTAGATLANYGVILKWSSIKKTLVEHFSDKRSLCVLEIEALTLQQGKNSLEFFYKQANELLTKTVDAIRLATDIEEEAMQSHMKQARDRILSCFVNGLHANYELPCRAMKPKNLSEAFNICNELRNASRLKSMLEPQKFQKNDYNGQKKNYSSKPFKADDGNKNVFFPSQPGPILREAMQANAGFRTNFRQYPEQPPPIPQRRQNSTWTNPPVFQNQLPTSSFGMPKPKSAQVPMEVDPSIRSNRVNYGNFPEKRPNSQSFHPQPDKLQRIFQILQEEEQAGGTEPLQAEEETSDVEEEHPDFEINFLA